MQSAGRSNWWFLLPIILNIMGGLIAYFVLKGSDPDMARNCLLLGIALLVAQIALAFVFGVVGEVMAAPGMR